MRPAQGKRPVASVFLVTSMTISIVVVLAVGREPAFELLPGPTLQLGYLQRLHSPTF